MIKYTLITLYVNWICKAIKIGISLASIKEYII